MNGGVWRSIRRGVDPAWVLVAGILWAGCGREAQSPPSSPRADVRGDPIQGEPIVAQAPSTSTVSTGGVGRSAADVSVQVTVDVKVAGEGAKVGGPGPVLAGPTPTPVVSVTGAAGNQDKPIVVASVGKGATGTAASPLTVGFDKLASFAYALPDGPVDTNTVAQAAATNQIPSTIKALNDQFISLKGFMLPLKVEKGLVTELLIMRDQSMCCYGTVPKITEWVSVKMVGDGVKPVMDQAVTLFGKLKVGEMYENGYLVGIYALDGERMAGPLDL